MATAKPKSVCEKCQQTLADSQFFHMRDGSPFHLCKKCATMHVDNWDPETYLWLLEKFDVPHIPHLWNMILQSEIADVQDPAKPAKKAITGMSVLGKYLSKMRLVQHKNDRWADTERLAEEHAKKLAADGNSSEDMDALKQEIEEKYAAGAISEAEYKTFVYMKKEDVMPVNPYCDLPPRLGGDAAGATPTINFSSDYAVDLGSELTEEDKKKLAIKWGVNYSPHEWVLLEQFFAEMCDSFEIRDAARENTLKLLCKTNLKMNQSLDMNDMDGFKKLSAVYDQMMKSAKFTAAQNKEAADEGFDSIGSLVLLCEQEMGFLPRFDTEIPQDKVDATLKDLKTYTYKLVTQDSGLGDLIEEAIKKMEIQQQMEKDLEEDNTELEDDDFEAYAAAVEADRKADEDALAKTMQKEGLL